MNKKNMKHLLNLILLLAVSASYAQLHISSGTELYVAEEAAFYTNEDVNNQGTLTFKSDTEVNFTLDAGLDNSAGSIAFNDATLVIGSGTTNANSTDNFTFGTNDEVKNVVLDKSSGTTNVIGGHLGISETLKLTSGTLTAGDKITMLNPSVGQEAYVVESTGGTANLSVEKFYPAKRAFRMVASPVNGSSLFDNWQNGGANETGIGTHITGSATGANGFDQTETGNPSLFYFDNGWQAIANTNATNLTAGTPYRLMIRGDRDPNLLLDNDATPNPTTLLSTGTLEVGTVTKTFPSAGSSSTFAFVANPYQSRIDVSEVLSNNSNAVDDKYWVWDPMINTRGGFVLVAENNTNNPTVWELTPSDNSNTSPFSTVPKFIEPGQAFFTQVTQSNPSIQFTESVKDVTTTLPKSAPFSDNQMSMLLDLKNEGNQVIDAIRLRFAADGITEVDAADIAKMGNLDENLASVNENSLFTIQRRNFPENDEVIPLFTNNWRNQDYSFMANLNNFGTTAVYLVDAYLGTETLLEDGQTYSFDVDESISESVDTSRFSLKFDTETMGVEDEDNKLFSLYPNPAKDLVNIQTSLALGSQVSIEIYNMLGQQVHAEKQTLKASSLQLEVSNFTSGVYIVKLNDEAGNKQSTQLIKE
ncbi:T9SS type A sorting domain-containing protein [Psychroflexus maritimus]|uniref:T9SS type A sorting domain-containing protein n=1 Tax=Psychroflexus maritimus TaxID=2714865 RepID=A0A967DZH5_9FLAO|nr:T9SS type A sorting domain-containing protein [Psychroflexus maritimus]NGZ90213.1 T9SS type A sorting domain-containing protein [Psychroflexus maritimus]